MTRVLVTRKLTPAVEARLRATYDADLNTDDVPYSADALLSRAAETHALLPTVTDKLDAALIKALPDSVRIISSFGVGIDHIDLEAAAARSIAVTNTPDVLTDATAELALLLILAAARGASAGERLVRAGNWTGWAPTAELGLQVTGKKLGIYGMGRIGQRLAEMARGLSMEIHYHSRKPLDPTLARGATYHPTPDSLAEAVDILSVHCASTPATRNSVNADLIARMGTNAILINTARGDIVDDDDLIRALQTGRLAAAGLDVFRGEPALDPRYRSLENVFLLPHLGSATVETRDAMGHRAIDNLDAFFAGETPPDLVAASTS